MTRVVKVFQNLAGEAFTWTQMKIVAIQPGSRYWATKVWRRQLVFCLAQGHRSSRMNQWPELKAVTQYATHSGLYMCICFFVVVSVDSWARKYVLKMALISIVRSRSHLRWFRWPLEGAVAPPVFKPKAAPIISVGQKSMRLGQVKLFPQMLAVWRPLHSPSHTVGPTVLSLLFGICFAFPISLLTYIWSLVRTPTSFHTGAACFPNSLWFPVSGKEDTCSQKCYSTPEPDMQHHQE